MGGTIAAQGPVSQSAGAVLSLIFAEGKRPDGAAVAALTLREGVRFSVGHGRAGAEGWLELLVMGMAIDCRALAGAPPPPVPSPGALLGLPAAPAGEAITLEPGPHLAEAAALLPVVRATVMLALDLAQLPGLLAVCWNPAQCWMAPDWFRKVAEDWLGGGPFPALGLTSLHRQDDGAMTSTGLAFFTGQELLIPSAPGLSAPDQARIAVRLINALVERDALDEPVELTGPGGEALGLTPLSGGTVLRVTPVQDAAD